MGGFVAHPRVHSSGRCRSSLNFHSVDRSSGDVPDTALCPPRATKPLVWGEDKETDYSGIENPRKTGTPQHVLKCTYLKTQTPGK